MTIMDEKERKGPDLSSEELYLEAGAGGRPSRAWEGTARGREGVKRKFQEQTVISMKG